VLAFKELTGITRKYAIPLLEYLDREHVNAPGGGRACYPVGTGSGRDLPRRATCARV